MAIEIKSPNYAQRNMFTCTEQDLANIGLFSKYTTVCRYIYISRANEHDREWDWTKHPDSQCYTYASAHSLWTRTQTANININISIIETGWRMAMSMDHAWYWLCWTIVWNCTHMHVLPAIVCYTFNSSMYSNIFTRTINMHVQSLYRRIEYTKLIVICARFLFMLYSPCYQNTPPVNIAAMRFHFVGLPFYTVSPLIYSFPCCTNAEELILEPDIKLRCLFVQYAGNYAILCS